MGEEFEAEFQACWVTHDTAAPLDAADVTPAGSSDVAADDASDAAAAVVAANEPAEEASLRLAELVPQAPVAGEAAVEPASLERSREAQEVSATSSTAPAAAAPEAAMGGGGKALDMGEEFEAELQALRAVVLSITEHVVALGVQLPPAVTFAEPEPPDLDFEVERRRMEAWLQSVAHTADELQRERG